jgi:hypothetical protein
MDECANVFQLFLRGRAAKYFNAERDAEIDRARAETGFSFDIERRLEEAKAEHAGRTFRVNDALGVGFGDNGE